MQVGDHHRKADRHHGLAQLLALHAPEHLVLQHEAERRHDHEHHREGEQPRPGRLRDLEAEIAAQQIERAVREVHVAHQPEDQREAGGDEEIERAERDPPEDRVEEDALAAEGLLEPLRPGGEHQPEDHRDHDRHDQRPDRISPDELLHAVEPLRPARLAPRTARP
jgi:hypothetical protein